MAKKTDNRLGKGLGALIPDANTYNKPIKNIEVAAKTGSIAEVDISKVETNPFQPRTLFDEQSLKELSESISELGIIQPITVRILKKGKFQLISGERRLRAAKMAGLTKIPAYVRKANDQEIIEFALVENIQRKDLNPIEISITFQRLMEECELTQERLSERTGKGRSSIANYLRLLKLPPEIQAGLRSNKISMGHAKVLSSLPDRHNILKIFYKILSGGLSVKKTQSEVDAILYPDDKPKTKTQALPDNYVSIKKKIEEKLGTKVDIKLSNKEKGKLIINFDDKDSFDTIIKSLS